MTPEIVTRKEWGAQEFGLEVYTTTWPKRTGHYTHYSAGPPGQSVRSIQDFHLDKGWGDIGYNWLVDDDGRAYEGRRGTWLAIGAHAANNNTANIGTCFIGRDSDVTDAAKRTIRWVYDEACRLAGRQLAKRYHSMTSATECPGDRLRSWVASGMAVTVSPASETQSRRKWSPDSTHVARKVMEGTGLLTWPQVFDRLFITPHERGSALYTDHVWRLRAFNDYLNGPGRYERVTAGRTEILVPGRLGY